MKETLYVDITTIPPSMVVSFMNKFSMLSFVGVSGIVVAGRILYLSYLKDKLKILLHFHTENRENKDDGHQGEGHAGDGSDGEIEPEDFLGAVGEERQKSQDG